MAADHRVERVHRSRSRRSWGQRLVLALGSLVVVVALVAAGAVAWTAWKLRSIERQDLALDALADDEPRNYLLVGSDSREGGDPVDPNAVVDHKPLADTIIVVRVDPRERRAAMLSLPRDLWVTDPDGDEGRINAVYASGHQALVDTIRSELAIPIHHYVEVDFRGFQEIVGAVGGVPMWFETPMRDRNTGLLVENPGCTTLDGVGALQFARARHLQYYDDARGRFTSDGTGDLGRISRQQLLVRRLAERAKDQALHNPLTLKRLVDVGTSNVTIDADLAVSDLLALGERFSSFDADQLRTYTLPVDARTTSGGASVVDLAPVEAEPVLDLFRDPAGAADPTTTTVPPNQVEVTVLNSSGRSGLAAQVGGHLAVEGFVVAGLGNGEELGHPAEASTIVRYGAGADAEAATVAAAVAPDAALLEDPSLEAGRVVVFLGADHGGDPSAADPAGSVGAPAIGEVAATSTSTTTTTTAPPPSDPVGVLPEGDAPAGRRCG